MSTWIVGKDSENPDKEDTRQGRIIQQSGNGKHYRC